MDGMEFLEEYRNEVLGTGEESDYVETIYQKVPPQSIFCDEVFIGEEEITDEICLPVNIDPNSSFNSVKQEEENDPLANSDAPILEDLKEFLKKKDPEDIDGDNLEIFSANEFKPDENNETPEKLEKDSIVSSIPGKSKKIKLGPKSRKRKKQTKGCNSIGSSKTKFLIRLSPKKKNLQKTLKSKSFGFPSKQIFEIKKIRSEEDFQISTQEMLSIKSQIPEHGANDTSDLYKDISFEKKLKRNQSTDSSALQEKYNLKSLRVRLNKNEVRNFFKRKLDQGETLGKKLKGVPNLVPKTDKNTLFDNENIILCKKQSPKLDGGSPHSPKKLIKLVKLNKEQSDFFHSTRTAKGNGTPQTSVKSQTPLLKRKVFELNVKSSKSSTPLKAENPNAVKSTSGTTRISAFRSPSKKPRIHMDLSSSSDSKPTTSEYKPILYPVKQRDLKIVKRFQEKSKPIVAEDNKNNRPTEMKINPVKMASPMELNLENSQSNATDFRVGKRIVKCLDLPSHIVVKTALLTKSEYIKKVGKLPRNVDECESSMNESGKKSLTVYPNVNPLSHNKTISSSSVPKPSTTTTTGKLYLPIKKVILPAKYSSGYERLYPPKNPVEAVFEKIQNLIDNKVSKEVAKSLQNLSSQISKSNTIKQEIDSPKKKLTFGCDLATAHCIFEALKQYFGDDSKPKLEASKQTSMPDGVALPHKNTKNQSKASQLLLGKPNIPVVQARNTSKSKMTSKITTNQKIVINPFCGKKMSVDLSEFQKARLSEERRNNITLEHNYVLADDSFPQDSPSVTKNVKDSINENNSSTKIEDRLSDGNETDASNETPSVFANIPARLKAIAKSHPAKKTTDAPETDDLAAKCMEKREARIASSTFKCMACDFTTPTRAEMEYHVKTVHNNISKCYICGASIKFSNCLEHFQQHRLGLLSP